MVLIRALLRLTLSKLGLTGLTLLGLLFVLLAAPARAQGGSQEAPLRIEITEGVVEPVPVAIPGFVAETPGAADLAREMAQVVAANLTSTGLFREIPAEAHVARIAAFDAPVAYADWRAINAQALLVGAVAERGGRVTVRFRLHDVFAGTELGQGLQLDGTRAAARRIAHKVSDQVYARITGEGGYFDSRVVFVDERGPKNARRKRLAIMDQDGANVQFLTDGSALVLAPRVSATGDRVLYTSYASGFPQVHLLEVGRPGRQVLADEGGQMTFSPRFSPDGRSVLYSAARGGNTDLFLRGLGGGRAERLTSSPAIDTAPSFAPDGRRIVFESDRSGASQLYVMPAAGGAAQRISFGQGRYGTPVWSPRGDLIAFTKQAGGRFHIGVMRPDGSEERLLTAAFLDEGPTWAPNGRVLMFTRQTAGAAGQPALFAVDVSGRNLRRVPTPGPASDPAWSPLLP